VSSSLSSRILTGQNYEFLFCIFYFSRVGPSVFVALHLSLSMLHDDDDDDDG
jgi:hypothetical protein